MSVGKKISCFMAAGILFGCGEQLETIDGFPEPVHTPNAMVAAANNLGDLTIFKPKTQDGLQAAFDLSQTENKPVLIDFTGYACVNCRKMEEYVWLDPAVFSLLRDDFIIVSLYVDDRTTTPKQLWLDYQKERYNAMTQPLYDIVNGANESQVSKTANYAGYHEPAVFQAWLEEGLKNFHK